MKSTINLLNIVIVFFLISCVSIPQRSKRANSNAENEPILIIDSKGHSAYIQDIVFTRDGKQLVSASQDKSIRVWDIEAERTVRIIRGEIGDGREGKIFAMALSPDDHYLAVGGWMGPNAKFDRKDVGSIRLYDFQTGELLALLRSHKDVVITLSFSPDSKWLASGSADKRVKIWDVRTRSLLRTLKGHEKEIYDVAFSPDGTRIVSASNDNTLKLWNTIDGSFIGTMWKHKDKVYTVEYSPDGKFIASGGFDNKLIIWDSRGMHVKTINYKAIPASISFSPDSEYLLTGAGSLTDEGSSPHICNVYKTSTWELLTSFTKHDNSVVAAAFAPDGKSVATGGGNNHDIYIWDALTGELQAELSGEGARVQAVGFNKSGGSIGFTNKWTDNYGFSTLSWAFDLGYFGVEQLSSHDDYTHPVIEQNDWFLSHGKGGDYGFSDAVLFIERYVELYYSGRTKKIITGRVKKIITRITRDGRDGYRHRSYTFTPDGSLFISGGNNGHLKAYDLDGKVVTDFIGHTGDVVGVAVSPDGSRLISGSADQTVKIWSLKELKKKGTKNRKPLATLFAASNGEWVLWTPEGYFAASANGAKYIGYHVNKGPEKEAAYLSVDKLYNQFYRPDLVEANLKGRDISQYAKAVNIEKTIRGGLAPEIEFITKSGKPDEKDIILKANISDAGGGIGDITLYLNGIPISVESGGRGMKRISPSGNTASAVLKIEKLISLRNGINRISLMAYN